MNSISLSPCCQHQCCFLLCCYPFFTFFMTICLLWHRIVFFVREEPDESSHVLLLEHAQKFWANQGKQIIPMNSNSGFRFGQTVHSKESLTVSNLRPSTPPPFAEAITAPVWFRWVLLQPAVTVHWRWLPWKVLHVIRADSGQTKWFIWSRAIWLVYFLQEWSVFYCVMGKSV